MPVTATVTPFISLWTEYDSYAGQPALHIEGAGVQLKDDTAYGFVNPVSYTVGASTIQVGAEYDVVRTIDPGGDTMIPTVRVVSASELLIVGVAG